MRVSDPAASFSFEVPTNWGNAAAYPWEEGGTNVGVLLVAGPDPAKIGSDFSVPAIAIGVSANAGGLTPLALVQEDDYSSVCTAGPAQQAAEPGVLAAYRSWENCGPGANAFLLLLGIVPEGSAGLVGVVFQGMSEADLAYLEHILGSLQAEGGAVPTHDATPGAVDTPPAGGPYTITMDVCQNQHGQGVAEGIIRNEDTVSHRFSVVVYFYDLNGSVLNSSASFESPSLGPGESFRWQSIVASGLPSGEVTCTIKEIQMR